MHELFPDAGTDASQEHHWTKELLERQGSYATPVKNDEFLILTENGGAYQIPNFVLPPQLHNHGNYIISLSQLCRYLASKAEELGGNLCRFCGQ
jgi:flavin-dependent dehydrogenase